MPYGLQYGNGVADYLWETQPHIMATRVLSTLFCFALVQLNFGQKYDFSTTWDHEITLSPDSIKDEIGDHGAHRVRVYEASESEVADALKALMKEKDISYERLGPRAAAKNVDLGHGPMDLHVIYAPDKKADATDVLAVFLGPDGKPADADAARDASRALAVDLNRRIVQGQLDVVQKDVDKLQSKLDGVSKDHEKAVENSEDLQKDLEKSQDKASKNLKEAESMRKDIEKLQRKYDVSKDPKTLSKIADKQKDLAKLDKKQMDLMEDQQKSSKKLGKASEDVPDAADDFEALTKEKQEVDQVLEALKVKLASIH